MGGCRNTLSSWLGGYAQNELHCHPGSVDAMHYALAHMSSSGKKSLHPLIQATKHLHRVIASADAGLLHPLIQATKHSSFHVTASTQPASTQPGYMMQLYETPFDQPNTPSRRGNHATHKNPW